MNQAKIGAFIQECRKEKKLTQAQLAEKLYVTDRAVSKWENGKSMPDSSIMLDLCRELEISVNELLNGEKSASQGEENERLLVEMAKELEEKNKMLWTSMWVIMIASIVGLFTSVLVSALLIPEGPWQLVVIVASCVGFLIPCFYALKLEVSVGAYRCKSCGHEFVPTYKEAVSAMHAGTTRHLKCPKCQKRTWCKKVLKK